MQLSNLENTFATTFHTVAQAPGGVARLRELILTLAVQGGLVSDEFQKIEKLKNIGDWAIGSGFPKDLQGDLISEIPFAKVSDMNLEGNDIYIEKANNYISKEVAKKYKIKIHPAGTVIFPKIGGAIATNKRRIIKIPTAIDNNCLGIIPNKSITKDYLYISLKSIDMAKYQAGTSVPALSQAVLGEIEISLPSIENQSRIVARVEELMRLCDALEEKGRLEHTQHQQLLQAMLDSLTQTTNADELARHWQRLAQHFDLLIDRPEAVDALEQTILQLAVRGLLVQQDPSDEPASELLKKIRAEKDRLIAEGKIKKDKPLPVIAEDEKPFELPVGWQWGRLGEIANNRLGKMLDKAKNTGKSYPYLRNTNVQWGWIDLLDIKEIFLEDGELEELRLKFGDLLICEGGYPGRCALWESKDLEMYFQKALHRVRPFGNISSNLIAFNLESDSKSGNLEQHFTGATIKHFVGQALDRYVVALPPLAEQSRIVARVTELRALCQQLRGKLTQARTTQTQLAQAWVEQVAA